jgi:phospholipid/cholesterol/gamma-HCH transport system ATP-binding protein
LTGVEVKVEGLSKSFGRANIWSDVTLTLPPGEVSVLLGPSGTGKSVFLKTLIGLLKPEKGSIVIHDTDLVRCSESRLYEIRKLFGVLFQDGALFGSMNLYDNIAFPLREHTKKSEAQIRDVVAEKMHMVGLTGDEKKLPGEISGGMRKRAGLARALVLDPEIILFDEPDSGLDPVRTAYLNQLIIDLNAQTDSTFLIVTHDINTAQTVPDNIGMLYRKHLAMFGPREVLLTSEEPVVSQFLNGRRQGPIGMSEEKDTAQAAREMQEAGELAGLPPMKPQLQTSPGVGERAAVARRRERVMQMLHTLPPAAQQAIRESYAHDPMPMRTPERITVGAGPGPSPAPRPAPQPGGAVRGYPPPGPGYGQEPGGVEPGYGGGPPSGPSSRPGNPPPPSGPGRHRP